MYFYELLWSSHIYHRKGGAGTEVEETPSCSQAGSTLEGRRAAEDRAVKGRKGLRSLESEQIKQKFCLWHRGDRLREGGDLAEVIQLRSNNQDSKPCCLLLDLRLVSQLCAENWQFLLGLYRAGAVAQGVRPHIRPFSWFLSTSQACLILGPSWLQDK